MRQRPRRSPVTIAALACGTVLAACGSSGGPQTIGPAQNGQTVSIAKGQRIIEVLPGTKWNIDLSPPFGPLTELSVDLTSGRTSQETIVFRAGASGGATIHAKRTDCAAHRCPPGSANVVVHIAVH